MPLAHIMSSSKLSSNHVSPILAFLFWLSLYPVLFYPQKPSISVTSSLARMRITKMYHLSVLINVLIWFICPLSVWVSYTTRFEAFPEKPGKPDSIRPVSNLYNLNSLWSNHTGHNYHHSHDHDQQVHYSLWHPNSPNRLLLWLVCP